jgi:hypothetical protein
MGRLVGHNIIGFDIPYLMKWSSYNGIKVPSFLTPFGRGKGRFFPDVFTDTMLIDAMGKFGEMISLDNLSKAYGFSGKSGNGKFFYQMNRSDQIEYLTNDVEQVLNIYRKQSLTLGLWQLDKCTMFDIETEPKSIELIEAQAPAFKPENVKVGNLKDQDKIDAKIEDARQNHIQSIVDKAGLSPLYSNPCAIGYQHAGDFDVTLDFADGDPKGMVEKFWRIAGALHGDMQEKNL